MNVKSSESVHKLLADPEFQALIRQKRTVSVVLTMIQLLLYFGFIALIAYDKPFLAQTIADGSAITIGIPIAVGVIVLSWVLTGIYILWANTRYDAMVNSVKKRLGE